MPMTKVAQISPKNASKAFGGRASPGPAGGAYSAPPDLLARFKNGGRDKGRRKRKRQKGIDS